MMSLWDALRMNMMISYQELVRTFLSGEIAKQRSLGHTGAAGDGRRRGGYAGLGESRGGSFQ
ncbi:Uncharacterised protein [Klebsiella pneumoniae]|nr:Uncharacterised protein [Klebsiella pneumoniae]